MGRQQHFTVIATTDLFDDVVLALDDHGGHRKFANLVDGEGLFLVLVVVLIVLEIILKVRKIVLLVVVGLQIVKAAVVEVVLEVGMVEIVVIKIEIAIEITVRIVGQIVVELLRHLTGGRIHHPVRVHWLVHLLLLLVHHLLNLSGVTH